MLSDSKVLNAESRWVELVCATHSDSDTYTWLEIFLNPPPELFDVD